MTPKEIYEKLLAAMSSVAEPDGPAKGQEVVRNFNDGTAESPHPGDKDPWFEVEPYDIETVCKLLKTDPALHMDYLECITGTDFPEEGKIHVVYHVYSYAKKHRIVLKCFLDREDPALPTLCDVWRTANWQERECFDLLGVLFDGHPDLRRLLLPDDWEGHPLRKDYEEADDYHGIPTVRPNPVELFAIKLPEKKPEKPKSDEQESAS